MNQGARVSTDAVKAILLDTLGVKERDDAIKSNTLLMGGALPELDSLAVVEVILALEERFEIVVDDSDVTAEVFETLDSLTEFVNSKCR